MKLTKWLQTQELVNYLQGSDERPKEWGRFLCRFFGWTYWEGAQDLNLWELESGNLESQIPTIISQAQFCLSLATSVSFPVPRNSHPIAEEIRSLTAGHLAVIQVPQEHQLLFYACIARVKNSVNAPLHLSDSLLSYMASPMTVSWRKFAPNLEWKKNDQAIILFRSFLKIWRQEGI